jgi:hypothetical protein
MPELLHYKDSKSKVRYEDRMQMSNLDLLEIIAEEQKKVEIPKYQLP